MRSVRQTLIGIVVGSMLVVGTAASSMAAEEPADIVAATGGSAQRLEPADVVSATGGGLELPHRPVLPATDPLPSSPGTEVDPSAIAAIAAVGLVMFGGYALRRRRHHWAVS
jgi:MYXO-CTERM domain-containing protein